MIFSMRYAIILITLTGVLDWAHADSTCDGLLAGSGLARNLSRLELDFDHKFFESTGVSLKTFVQAAEKSPPFKHAVRYFKNEEFQVAMFRPEEARRSFMKNGITNVHQSKKTKASAGERSIDRYIQTRINVEAGLVGMPPESYAATSATDRPKYALLRMNPRDTDGSYDHFASAYGDDVFIFKKNRIRSRTTFALGDSIDKAATIHGVDSDFFGFTPQTWDGGLIPWSAREILAIEAGSNLKASKEGDTPVQIFLATEYDLKLKQDFLKMIDPVLAKYSRLEVPGFYDKSKSVVANGAKYVEAQIFGELKAEDIEAFEFTNTPPSASFVKFLKSHAIKIYDARRHPTAEYVVPK